MYHIFADPRRNIRLQLNQRGMNLCTREHDMRAINDTRITITSRHIQDPTTKSSNMLMFLQKRLTTFECLFNTRCAALQDHPLWGFARYIRARLASAGDCANQLEEYIIRQIQNSHRLTVCGGIINSNPVRLQLFQHRLLINGVDRENPSTSQPRFLDSMQPYNTFLG